MFSAVLDVLFQSVLIYPVLGALAAAVLFDLWARGTLKWVRTLPVGTIVVAAAAATAYGVALRSADAGLPVVLRAIAAAWAVAWGLMSLMALWRTSLLIAPALDGRYVFCALSIVSAGGFVFLVVMGVRAEWRLWAYATVPVIAGALYRLSLVLNFVRLSAPQKDAVGNDIDNRLREGLRLGATSGETFLFDPLGLRARRRRREQNARHAVPRPSRARS